MRLLIAWCELRADFRNFRTDRVTAADFLDERYPERPAALRARWRKAVSEMRREEGGVGGAGADIDMGASGAQPSLSFPLKT